MTGLRAQGDSSILNQVNQSARSFFSLAAIASLFCLFFLLASLISAQGKESKHVLILTGGGQQLAGLPVDSRKRYLRTSSGLARRKSDFQRVRCFGACYGANSLYYHVV